MTDSSAALSQERERELQDSISNLHHANSLLEKALVKAGQDLDISRKRLTELESLLNEKDVMLMEMNKREKSLCDHVEVNKKEMEKLTKEAEVVKKENMMWREKWAESTRTKSLEKERERRESFLPKPSTKKLIGSSLEKKEEVSKDCSKESKETSPNDSKESKEVSNKSPQDSKETKEAKSNQFLSSNNKQNPVTWWECAQSLLQTPLSYDSVFDSRELSESLVQLDKKCRSYFLELSRKAADKVSRSIAFTHPHLTPASLSKSQIIGALHDGFFQKAMETCNAFGYTPTNSNTPNSHPTLYGLLLLSQQTYFRESLSLLSPTSSTASKQSSSTFFSKDLAKIHSVLAPLYFDEKLKPKWHKIMTDLVLIHYRLKATHPRLEWYIPAYGSLSEGCEVEVKFEEKSPIVQCCYRPGIRYRDVEAGNGLLKTGKVVEMLIKPIVFT
jgi:hypothetical protein